MGFRVRRVSFNDCNETVVTTPKMCEDKTLFSNYFTVVVGNNGTGKSRFLSQLVSSLNRRTKSAQKVEYIVDSGESDQYILPGCKDFLHYHAETSDNSLAYRSPRVIAITSSISDKFPSDASFRRSSGSSHLPFQRRSRAENYFYLGMRTQTNTYSGKSQLLRALDFMMTSKSFVKDSKQYEAIFNYLNYKPVLAVSYRLMRRASNEAMFQSEGLRSIVSSRAESRRFSSSYLSRALEEWSEDVWNKLSRRYGAVLGHVASKDETTLNVNFDFSSETIYVGEDCLRVDPVAFFKEINTLRKLELLDSPIVKLYTREGGELDFADASSGEASILSTLLALIPLVRDNSLIVIDEPEISLHPSWQSRYINLIDRILSPNKGCHVVVATHSHFILSDLPLDRSSILHFKKEKSRLAIERVKQETFGKSAEELLLNVFEMPSSRNYYLAQEVSEALELLKNRKVNSNRFEYLAEKFEIYQKSLSSVDPLHDVLKAIVSLKGDGNV